MRLGFKFAVQRYDFFQQLPNIFITFLRQIAKKVENCLIFGIFITFCLNLQQIVYIRHIHSFLLDVLWIIFDFNSTLLSISKKLFIFVASLDPGTSHAPLIHCRSSFGMGSVVLRSWSVLPKERKRTKKESKKDGKRTQLRDDDGRTGLWKIKNEK